MKVSIPFFQHRPLHRAAAADAIGRDAFLQHSWRIPGKTERGTRRLAETVADWVRTATAGAGLPGRPAHVALALTCRDSRGRIVHSDSLGLFQPSVFVAREGATRVESFLAEARFRDPGEGANLVAALLHIGDLAYDADTIRAT